MSLLSRKPAPPTVEELVSEGEQLLDKLHTKKGQQLDEYARHKLEEGHPQEAFVFFEISKSR